MSYRLAENVYRMTNEELIGLAKNRFLDRRTQKEIVKHPYRRAKSYLAQNTGICADVREYLWDMKGYTLKCDLIQSGNCRDQPDKYRELYYEQQARFRRSPWNMVQTFLRYSHWTPGTRYTPSDVLESIYKEWVAPYFHGSPDSYKDFPYQVNYRIRGLLKHPNCPLDVAVKISTSEDLEIRSLAFKKIAELS